MRIQIKQILVGVLLVSLIVALSACAGPAEPQEPEMESEESEEEPEEEPPEPDTSGQQSAIDRTKIIIGSGEKLPVTVDVTEDKPGHDPFGKYSKIDKISLKLDQEIVHLEFEDPVSKETQAVEYTITDQEGKVQMRVSPGQTVDYAGREEVSFTGEGFIVPEGGTVTVELRVTIDEDSGKLPPGPTGDTTVSYVIQTQ